MICCLFFLNISYCHHYSIFSIWRYFWDLGRFYLSKWVRILYACIYCCYRYLYNSWVVLSLLLRAGHRSVRFGLSPFLESNRSTTLGLSWFGFRDFWVQTRPEPTRSSSGWFGSVVGFINKITHKGENSKKKWKKSEKK